MGRRVFKARSSLVAYMLAFCETRFSDVQMPFAFIILTAQCFCCFFFWQLTEVPFAITASSVHSENHESNGL